MNARVVCLHIVYSSILSRRISSIKLIFKSVLCLSELMDLIEGELSHIDLLFTVFLNYLGPVYELISIVTPLDTS